MFAMAEGRQLDPWQSSYLQLKSMSAMLSDIHHKFCKLSEGGMRPEETKLGFNPNLEIQDRRSPSEEVHGEIEGTGRQLEENRIGIEILQQCVNKMKKTNEERFGSLAAFTEERFSSLMSIIRNGEHLRSASPSIPVDDLNLGGNSDVLRSTSPGVQGPSTNLVVTSGNIGQRTAIGDQPVKNQAPSDLNQESGEGISFGSFSRGFGEKQGPEVVEEFNKLIQEDDIESYNEKFEELRDYMLAYNPALPESYFISSYISGLKQEIKNLVKLSRPKFLAAAYEEARMHYDAVQAIISDVEQEYSDRSNSIENIEDWDAHTGQDADVGCQGLRVLGVHPKESNREAWDQSMEISTEFKRITECQS